MTKFNILESLESLFKGTDKDKIKTSLKDIVAKDFTIYNLQSVDDITEEEKEKIYGEKQNMLQIKNNIESAEDFVRDLTKPVQCKEENSVENNSNFLKRHIQVGSIVKFYNILKDNLFEKDYKDAPSFLRDEEGLLKDINRKIEQYNNFVGMIFKEVCEAEIVPAKQVTVTVTTDTASTTATDYKETDIYTYYKDMIFSIFDKD